jgi:hypothetical protein
MILLATSLAGFPHCRTHSILFMLLLATPLTLMVVVAMMTPVAMTIAAVVVAAVVTSTALTTSRTIRMTSP